MDSTPCVERINDNVRISGVEKGLREGAAESIPLLAWLLKAGKVVIHHYRKTTLVQFRRSCELDMIDDVVMQIVAWFCPHINDGLLEQFTASLESVAA